MRSYRASAVTFIAGLLTGIAGFMAFNVIDGVFGQVEAILGLAAWIAITVFVVIRSTPGKEEPDG